MCEERLVASGWEFRNINYLGPEVLVLPTDPNNPNHIGHLTDPVRIHFSSMPESFHLERSAIRHGTSATQLWPSPPLQSPLTRVLTNPSMYHFRNLTTSLELTADRQFHLSCPASSRRARVLEWATVPGHVPAYLAPGNDYVLACADDLGQVAETQSEQQLRCIIQPLAGYFTVIGMLRACAGHKN